MRDTIRQYVEAAMSALPMDRARELASTLIEQGQAGRGRAADLARDLVEWSKNSRERVRELIGNEVKKQVEQLGLATKDDVDSLKQRLWKLEGPAPSSGSRATPGASGTTKRTTATTKRTTASGTTPKRTTTSKRTTSKRTSTTSEGE